MKYSLSQEQKIITIAGNENVPIFNSVLQYFTIVDGNRKDIPQINDMVSQF